MKVFWRSVDWAGRCMGALRRATRYPELDREAASNIGTETGTDWKRGLAWLNNTISARHGSCARCSRSLLPLGHLPTFETDDLARTQHSLKGSPIRFSLWLLLFLPTVQFLAHHILKLRTGRQFMSGTRRLKVQPQLVLDRQRHVSFGNRAPLSHIG